MVPETVINYLAENPTFLLTVFTGLIFYLGYLVTSSTGRKTKRRDIVQWGLILLLIPLGQIIKYYFKNAEGKFGFIHVFGLLLIILLFSIDYFPGHNKLITYKTDLKILLILIVISSILLPITKLVLSASKTLYFVFWSIILITSLTFIAKITGKLLTSFEGDSKIYINTNLIGDNLETPLIGKILNETSNFIRFREKETGKEYEFNVDEVRMIEPVDDTEDSEDE